MRLYDATCGPAVYWLQPRRSLPLRAFSSSGRLNRTLSFRKRLQAMCDTLFALSAEVQPQPFPSSPFLFGRVHERSRVGRALDHFAGYHAAAHYLCHAGASCDINEGRTHSLRLSARPETGSSARHRKMWHCRPHNSPQSAEVDLCSILTQAGSDSDGRPNQDTPSMVDQESNKWGLVHRRH